MVKNIQMLDGMGPDWDEAAPFGAGTSQRFGYVDVGSRFTLFSLFLSFDSTPCSFSALSFNHQM